MQVEKTTTITLDNKSFEVAQMSPEVQQMVAYLDEWRQREVDQTSELLLVRGALRDLQNALAQQIQADITPPAPANDEVVDVKEVKKATKKAKKTA